MCPNAIAVWWHSCLKDGLIEAEAMRKIYAVRGVYMMRRLEQMGIKIAGNPSCLLPFLRYSIDKQQLSVLH